MAISPPPKSNIPTPAVSLAELLGAAARHPRRKAEPTGDVRERIAVALRGSRPSFFRWLPTEAYTLYLTESDRMREMYDEMADRLLAHFDVLDLEIVDRRRDW